MSERTPVLDPERTRIRAYIEAQNERVAALLEALSEAEVTRRPSPDRWSIAEHLAHIAVVNQLYVRQLEPALARARQGGPVGEGPFRRGPIGRMFVRAMSPPVKRRLNSPKRMLPPPTADAEEAEHAFHAAQEALRATLEGADNVDLGRVMVRSPVVRILRVRAIQAFEAVLAHTDRHLWLIEEQLGTPAPGRAAASHEGPLTWTREAEAASAGPEATGSRLPPAAGTLK